MHNCVPIPYKRQSFKSILQNKAIKWDPYYEMVYFPMPAFQK